MHASRPHNQGHTSWSHTHPSFHRGLLLSSDISSGGNDRSSGSSSGGSGSSSSNRYELLR